MRDSRLDKISKINKISQMRNVNEGFRQGYLTFDKYEILMNILSAGADFTEHAHEFAQLVYCYEGEFILFAEGSEYIVKKGSTFNIKPYVSHKIEIVQDIITFDLKYLMQTDYEQKPKVEVGLFTEETFVYDIPELTIYKLPFGKVETKECVIELDGNKENYILSAFQSKVIINEEEYDLDELSIYRVNREYFDLFEIKNIGQSDLFLIQI